MSSNNDYHITVVTWALKDDDVIDKILQSEYESIRKRIDIMYIAGIYNTISTKVVNIYHKILKKTNSYEGHKMIGYTPYENANLKKRIKLYLKYIRYLNHEKRFARLAYSQIINANICPDIIISSYGDFGDHILALKLKKRFSNAKLIADYRDPAIRYFWPPAINAFAKKMVAQVAETSDRIIGVTRECIDEHRYPEKNIVIPNGFDRDDIKKISSKKGNLEIENDNKFHICLTGTVYTDRRDHFHVLFDALKKLESEGKVRISDFAFDYAGQYSWYVSKKVGEIGCGKIFCDHGYIERSKALKLQQNAQILMVLSCNNEGESGVLTGKFLEYMMSGKSILAIISGNKPNSIIKEIVNDANLGFCYEECSHERDFDKLCDYLCSAYREFLQIGKVTDKSKKKMIDQFDYRNIANQVESLIESL